MTSFPSNQEGYQQLVNLHNNIIYPTHALYANATWMFNMRMQRFPAYIIYVETVEDVQKVVRFARDYNLMVTIRSSGHSLIGRSTHHGSVVINLQNMKGRQFQLSSDRAPAGEVTVESGNTWMEVYRAVDEQVTHDGPGGEARRRVIVGSGFHSEAIGGYTLGGGTSPLCRRLGLAVDNLLEATIVLADGRKAVVNSEGTTITDLDDVTEHLNDTSLFWALRGGGGGTWGVVTHFTFKLHFAPQRIRTVTVNWALYYVGTPIGAETIKHVLRQLGRLSRDWGGYVTLSPGMTLAEGATGHLTIFLNHFGTDNSSSNSEVDDLLNHDPIKAQYGKVDTRFETFLEYVETVPLPPGMYGYSYNTFLHSTIFDEGRLDRLVDFFMGLANSPTVSSLHTCTGTLIGGKMKRTENEATPINPLFRSGLLSLTCDLGWTDVVHQDDFYISKALESYDKLKKFGQGVYFNEPAEDLADWKHQFWGDDDTYNSLLTIKRTWDPDSFLWCLYCVGSDSRLNVTTDVNTTTTTTTVDPEFTSLAGCPGSSVGKTQAGAAGSLLVMTTTWLLARQWI